MNVTIRFFAQLREQLGPIHELTVPEATRLVGLLHEIAGRTPEGEAALFAPDGRLREYVIIMQNGTRVDRYDLELGDGDTIAVFPPVAGG